MSEQPGAHGLIVSLDIREMYRTDLWNDERRYDYLLREDVAKPLSADTCVWPSVLLGEQRSILIATQSRTLLEGIHMEHLAQGREESWCVLIASHVSPSSQFEPVDSCLLGYDVVDAWLLSGLSNCMYSAEEKKALSHWKHQLNAHHLFQLQTSAEEFVNATNKRVPEHAPFNVAGVWRLVARGEAG